MFLCQSDLRSRFEQRLVNWLFFNTSIGSPYDFERPRVVHGGVIKFRIFFKFLRFHSHDLARIAPIVSASLCGQAKKEMQREKQAGIGFGDPLVLEISQRRIDKLSTCQKHSEIIY